MNLPIPDSRAYLEAKPFPHCVVDGVFQERELTNLLWKWPLSKK